MMTLIFHFWFGWRLFLCLAWLLWLGLLCWSPTMLNNSVERGLGFEKIKVHKAMSNVIKNIKDAAKRNETKMCLFHVILNILHCHFSLIPCFSFIFSDGWWSCSCYRPSSESFCGWVFHLLKSSLKGIFKVLLSSSF